MKLNRLTQSIEDLFKLKIKTSIIAKRLNIPKEVLLDYKKTRVLPVKYRDYKPGMPLSEKEIIETWNSMGNKKLLKLMDDYRACLLFLERVGVDHFLDDDDPTAHMLEIIEQVNRRGARWLCHAFIDLDYKVKKIMRDNNLISIAGHKYRASQWIQKAREQIKTPRDKRNEFLKEFLKIQQENNKKESDINLYRKLGKKNMPFFGTKGASND